MLLLSKICFVLLIFNLLISLNISQNISIPLSEYEALYDLYNSTNGPGWKWFNYSVTHTIPWNFDGTQSDPCFDSWQGLQCGCYNISSCNIRNISVPAHKLTGTLPNSIGDFPLLQVLDLNSNDINGTLPESVGDLLALQYLSLAENFLRGTLPVSLSNLKNLLKLDVQNNVFTGVLPNSFYTLSSLEVLLLQANFFRGTLPSALNNLVNLSTYDISFNFYHGQLISWPNLNKLKVLRLVNNLLTGSIPANFSLGLQSLENLLLDGNMLNSTIPKELLRLSKLKALDLSYNYFTGRLPSNFSYAFPDLKLLILLTNHFTGPFPVIPNEKNANLEIVEFGNNTFSGPIPLSIGTYWLKLQGLSIERNSFTGTLPKFSSELFRLKELRCNRNFLHGNVTTYFNPMKDIFSIDVGINQFTGEMPNGVYRGLIFYLTYVNYFTGPIPLNLNQSDDIYYISTDKNYLTGNFPSWIDTKIYLNDFNVSSNLLSGPLLYNLTDRSKSRQLSLLAVAYNYLTGTLPLGLGKVLSLNDLFLNNNKFTGTLPQFYDTLENLEILFLQNNRFTGTIMRIDSLESLTNFDVSGNKLTGTLLDGFGRATSLKTFAASSNCFHGSIPSSFCELESLEVLALDGLSSGTSCLTRLFPGSPYFNSFILNRNFDSGIPSCLFSMSSIETLHLSGNGFSGTISSNLNISESLTDLTLSHNRLTGAIPSFLLTRDWNSFDLSYNRLTGEIPSNIPKYAADQSLALEINRLSGTIPSNLWYQHDIDILDGNMFECKPDHSDLPHHDKKYDDYSCGSDVANVTIYSWMIVFLVLILFLVYTANWMKRRSVDEEKHDENIEKSCCSRFFAFIEKLFLWKNYFVFCSSEFDQDNHTKAYNQGSSTVSRPAGDSIRFTNHEGEPHTRPSIANFRRSDVPFTIFSHSRRIGSAQDPFLINLARGSSVSEKSEEDRVNSHLPSSLEDAKLYLFKARIYTVCIWLIITLLLLPFYAVLTHFYHAYQYSYVWNISGILLTGELPGILLFCFLMTFLFILMRTFHVLILSMEVQFISFGATSDSPSTIADESTVSNPIISSEGTIRKDSSAHTRVNSSMFSEFNQIALKFPEFTSKPSPAANGKLEQHETGNLSTSTATLNSNIDDSKKSSSGNTENGPVNTQNSSLFTYWTQYSFYIWLSLVDFIIMLTADMFYVYIFLTYSTYVIIAAEIFLGFFKIWINNRVLWTLIPKLRRIFNKHKTLLSFLKACLFCSKDDPEQQIQNEHDKNDDENATQGIIQRIATYQTNTSFTTATAKKISKNIHEDSYYHNYVYSSHDITFITVMVLLNNILFPIISIFCISSDCFYNAFFSASSVSSSYTYQSCDLQTLAFNYCFRYQTFTESSSYYPPFIYNYQCASTLVINYAPVFIIMYTMEGLLLPCCKLLLRFIYEQYYRQESTESQTNPSRQTEQPTKSEVYSKETIINRESYVNHERVIELITYLLPHSLRDLTPKPSFLQKQQIVLFDKNRISVRVNSYLVVMMSFGALFPPLAVVICVAVITVTVYEEMVIGRLLYESERLGYGWYRKQLEKDCRGIKESFDYTLWSVIPVSSALFSYIVFDTWGDATGWQEAIIPSMILLVVPLMIFILYKSFDRILLKVTSFKESFYPNSKHTQSTDSTRNVIECRDMSTTSSIRMGNPDV